MWLTKSPRSPYLQVRFHDPDGSGRVIQVSTRETTERAAKIRAAEIVTEHQRDFERTRNGGKVTTEAVAAEYWDSELSRRKWAKTAFKWLNAIVDHLGEDTPYCEVTIADVADFVDEVNGTVSDTTVNRVLAIWRRMHNHATKVRRYPVEQIEWSQLMREEPEGRTRHLTPDELTAILRHLPEPAQAIVIFAVLCGARKAQVLGLTWDRVDMEHRTVTVFRKSRKRYAPLTLDLHPTAFAILERQAARGTTGLVFDTTNFRKVWERALLDAGVKDFRFHDLRHTFASWMARKASLAIVQRLLGHANITTTMRYAHVQREDLRASIHTLPSLEIQTLTDQSVVDMTPGVTQDGDKDL